MTEMQLPNDTSTRLQLALCERLGLDPEHVLLGRMVAESGQGDGSQVRVSWEGVAFLDQEEFDDVFAAAQRAPGDVGG